MANNTQPPATLDWCYEHYAKHFGFGYEEYRYSLRVRPDGSAEIVRRAMFRAYEPMAFIDLYLKVPRARREDSIVDGMGVKLVKRSSDEPTIITLSPDLSSSAETRMMRLDVTPALRAGETLEYETRDALAPGSVAVLYDQLEDKKDRPFNTFSLEISWPMRKLTLQLLLPYTHRSQATPDVWRGLSKISVGRAAHEIKGQLRSSIDILDDLPYFNLELAVDYPQQGFLYALKWTPPEEPFAQTEAVIPGAPWQPPVSPTVIGSRQDLVTWLHLSDLHYHHSDTYNADVVKDSLVRDVSELVKTEGLRPDFIVFTGDLAFSGQKEQYIGVEEFLKDLSHAAGIDSSDRVFIVPGNHDIDRSAIDEIIAHGSLQHLSSRDRVSQFLQPARDRSSVFTKFRHYEDFFNRFYRGTKHFSANDYFWIHRIELGPCTVGILGLNSAWMCSFNKTDDGSYKDEGHLLVGERQVAEALKALKAIGDTDLRIALLHHPFWALAEFDRDDVERKLRRSCHFILHGHLHQSDVRSEQNLDGDTVFIPAGACYDRRDRPNGYNFTRLNYRSGKGQLFLRRYSDRQQEWQPDLDATKARNKGVTGITIPSTAKSI